ncbi:hypothetical protein ACQPYA_23100 [Micromonospora sp. CA-263727]|uniref:hypothetical protein n=1 Tax=Micromonospora sp. CA-263727 TaxID=3239967 RepID=UPI003D8E70EA
MPRSVTNTAFAALLSAAGYGNAHGAFARQLNHAGRSQGSWRYDAASVYWWLRGRQPVEQVQGAMAEMLARKLGRSVAVTDLGFVATGVPASIVYPRSVEQAIEASERLWSRFAQQFSWRNSGTFQIDKALQAALAWRYDLSDGFVVRTGRRPVTSADVQSLHALTDHFTDLDRRHGGGSPHTRTMMADFLVRQVGPMLRGTYTDTIGRGLMGATASLSGQLAFIGVDPV